MQFTLNDLHGGLGTCINGIAEQCVKQFRLLNKRALTQNKHVDSIDGVLLLKLVGIMSVIQEIITTFSKLFLEINALVYFR